MRAIGCSEMINPDLNPFASTHYTLNAVRSIKGDQRA